MLDGCNSNCVSTRDKCEAIMVDKAGNPRSSLRSGENRSVRPLSLKIFPDSALRKICDPVTRFDGWIADILEEMLDLMRQSNGIGLAAPQAGVAQRFFVAEIDDQVLQLVNPSIKIFPGKDQMVEGCLSIPRVQVNVERAERIEVVGFDRSGKRMKGVFQGLWARVIQHEKTT